DMLCHFGEQLRDPHPAGAVLRPFEWASEQLVFAALEDIGMARILQRLFYRLRHGFAVELLQLGLVVESVDLGRASHHEQEDHALRLWREMRRTRLKRIYRIDFDFRLALQLHQRMHCHRSKAAPECGKEIAT